MAYLASSETIGRSSESANGHCDNAKWSGHTIDPDGDVFLFLKGTDPLPIIRVSSRHLILASPVFKAMLQGNFSESRVLKTNGFVTIPLSDEDAEAMLLLMRAIHGQFRSIPLILEFDKLAKVAFLVDKYEVLETVHMYIEKWADADLEEISDRLWEDEDLQVAVCIGWVLEDPAFFKITTSLFILRGCEDFNATGLPLPAAIANAISKRRIKLITAIFDKISQMREEYLVSYTPRCSKECDTMVLGSLSIAERELSLSGSHPAQKLYQGMSADSLVDQFQGLEFPSFHSLPGRKEGTRRNVKADCKAMDELGRVLQKIISGEKGLDIHRFNRYRRKNR